MASRLLEELEAIREENGGILRAEDVVRFAEQNPDSELHKKFEWNDEKAGVQFRLNQARSIIRMNVFVLPNTNQETRTYVSLDSDRQVKGGGYRHIADVMTEADRREMLLKQALREIQRWRQKYQGLKELAVIFGSIEEVEALEAINDDKLDLVVDAASEAS